VTHGGERIYISAAASDRPASVEVDPPPGWSSRFASSLNRGPRIKVRLAAVTAARARDGAILWRMSYYNVGDSRTVYLVGDALIMPVVSFESHAKEIIALDAQTGALRWSRRIGPLINKFGWLSTLLWWADAGGVAVTIDEDDAKSANGGRSFALLDATTGDIFWRGAEPPPDPRKLKRATSNGMVYSREERRRWPHTFIRAIRSNDGAELWRVACADSGAPLPEPFDLLAQDGWLYLLSCSAYAVRVHALDADSGRIIWRWRSPWWLLVLFLLGQALQRAREARRARTWRAFWGDALRLRWRRPRRPEGAPAMQATRDGVYVASYLGAFALRMRDGHRLWHALPFAEVSRLHVASTDADT
jgi:hypothetical protein